LSWIKEQHGALDLFGCLAVLAAGPVGKFDGGFLTMDLHFT
jgi:hypothetical protein